jgi:hypothetical protein
VTGSHNLSEIGNLWTHSASWAYIYLHVVPLSSPNTIECGAQFPSLEVIRVHVQMVSDQNVAAWLPGVGKPLEVRSAETPVPGEGELLVEVSERCQCQADPFRAAGD